MKLLAEMNPNSRRDGARTTRAPRMPSAISALRRSETFLLMSGCWFLGHCCNSISAFSTTPTIPTAHSHALSLRRAYTPHVSSTRHGWGAALRMAAQDGNEGITSGDKKPPGSVGGLRAMVGATTKRMSDAVRFVPESGPQLDEPDEPHDTANVSSFRFEDAFTPIPKTST